MSCCIIKKGVEDRVDWLVGQGSFAGVAKFPLMPLANALKPLYTSGYLAS